LRPLDHQSDTSLSKATLFFAPLVSANNFSLPNLELTNASLEQKEIIREKSLVKPL
tara:strand:- start:184 stop:351 length:168 start_codon:yes stop_codon:yes gene_type:complete